MIRNIPEFVFFKTMLFLKCFEMLQEFREERKEKQKRSENLQNNSTGYPNVFQHFQKVFEMLQNENVSKLFRQKQIFYI